MRTRLLLIKEIGHLHISNTYIYKMETDNICTHSVSTCNLGYWNSDEQLILPDKSCAQLIDKARTSNCRPLVLKSDQPELPIP